MRLVLLGPPGVGKGTQGARLSQALGVPSISTGELLRQLIASGKESRQVEEARQILRGVFVSDDLANQLAFEAVARRGAAGFILDGYPRSVAQAEALEQFLGDRGLALSRVLLFNVSEVALEGRVQGRRVCEACGATYHLHHLQVAPPLQESLCDLCGGALRARSEDSTAHKRSVRRHFYETRLTPLRLFYEEHHLLTEVNADGSPELIYNNICENLRSLI